MQEIKLRGIVGKEVTAEQVELFLEAAGGEPVTIVIDSPGGVLSEGVYIHNLLQRYSGQVTTVVEARAYSIASYIFMAGDKRVVMDNALLMIHEARMTVQEFRSSEAQKYTSMLDAANESIRKAYAKAMGVDELLVQTLWDSEGDVWYTSTTALEAGLATEIQGADGQLSANYLTELVALAPASFIQSLQQEKTMLNKVEIEALKNLGVSDEFIVSAIMDDKTAFEALSNAFVAMQNEGNENDDNDEEMDNEEKPEDEPKAEGDEGDRKEDEEPKAEESQEDEKDEPRAEGDEPEEDEEPEAKEDEGDEPKEDEEPKAEDEGDDDKEDDKDDMENHVADVTNLQGVQPVAIENNDRITLTAKAQWDKMVAEKVESGMPVFKAISKVAKENPGLRQEMINEVNNR